MSRNYLNEYAWQRQKYTLIKAHVDKNVGEQLKEKLKSNNKTIASWITENAKKYIKEDE